VVSQATSVTEIKIIGGASKVITQEKSGIVHIKLDPADEETCDRCGPGVHAMWITVTKAGPLAFCNHCFRKFQCSR